MVCTTRTSLYTYHLNEGIINRACEIQCDTRIRFPCGNVSFNGHFSHFAVGTFAYSTIFLNAHKYALRSDLCLMRGTVVRAVVIRLCDGHRRHRFRTTDHSQIAHTTYIGTHLRMDQFRAVDQTTLSTLDSDRKQLCRRLFSLAYSKQIIHG